MDIFGSKRIEGETYEGYRLRLKEEKQFFKQRSKGVLAWNNKTYIKATHGDIQVTVSND